MRRWLYLSLLFTACWTPVREPDCLFDKTCECKRADQCPTGHDCVDGKCQVIPDAGIPGDYGKPCEADRDCLFGPCLPKGPGNGKVCTQVCNQPDAGTCPRGWSCKQDSAARYLCTPPLEALCNRCTNDQDCNAIGDKCIALDGGTFCAKDCSLSGCIEGYDCRALATDAGVFKQCVPHNETCECGPSNVGLKRSCKNPGGLGTCFGFETCQLDAGYSGCDARTAAAEVCDGIDNDCDGLSDDADPSQATTGLPGYPDCSRGTNCNGKWFCAQTPDAGSDAGYFFFCSAPPVTLEQCNGIDDDCDGQVDEDFKDALGRFSHPRACGSCQLDCTKAIPNLLQNPDGGVANGAVGCAQVGGDNVCVPLLCAPGYFEWPQPDARLCMRSASSQCRPCTVDADCAVPGDVCNPLSNDVGRFCQQQCELSVPSHSPYDGCTGATGVQSCCPAGSTCESVAGKKLCTPKGNSCSCTPDKAGLARSCFRSSGAQLCIGQQICRADGGYDACDSSLTALELCDGLDNDCDGKVDQTFIGTKGTATWDTDEACGSCTTNCKAQWSPTIQHAIGGCTVSANTPSCNIVQCTQESVAGGRLCLDSSDCSPGFTCNPLFHQCVKPCSNNSCGAGEVCFNGNCTQSCTNDAQCTAAFGPVSACGDAGVCAARYQFVNADLEPGNGCECAGLANVEDRPDTLPGYPVAGTQFVDRDCDGIDGRVGRSLYVWAQSPSSQGTRANPYKTVAEAIAAFNSAQHDAILVAAGSYLEQVVLRNGVHVFGGYSPDFKKRDVVANPTLIEAPEPDDAAGGARKGSVNAENLSQATTFAGFTIRGYDVVTRVAAGQPGRNSYAVYAKNAPGLLLANNHVVGGRAGDASPAPAATAGATGQAGARGRDARECLTPSCANESNTGGLAGANSACPLSNGNPGAPSNPAVDPQQYNGGGLNGEGGSNATYRHSAPNQAQFCKYDCTVPGNGLNGLPAQNGGDGTAGARGIGCTNAVGALLGDEWAGGLGSSGGNGSPGRGGGGGGAGGCATNLTPATCTVGNRVGDLGATGGGGGAGGCGGVTGSGGASGGGSFGVFIVGAPPRVEGNIIEPGFGGAGGSGGTGGYGGLGGPGGAGGVNNQVSWCAGLGGAGGRGGNGGGGGGGGGGCGGMSFGIAGANIAGSGYAVSNVLRMPPLNAGGVGGSGGASPAGAGSTGTGGNVGISGTLRSF